MWFEFICGGIATVGLVAWFILAARKERRLAVEREQYARNNGL